MRLVTAKNVKRGFINRPYGAVNPDFLASRLLLEAVLHEALDDGQD